MIAVVVVGSMISKARETDCLLFPGCKTEKLIFEAFLSFLHSLRSCS